jgi:hypothetical protein
MKMQMRKILILAAIHNETIRLQVEFIHEALHGGIQVGKKGSVLRVELRQRCHFTLGDDQHVKLIAGRRMLKRNQVRGFVQTRDRNEKTHVGKYPTDNVYENRMPENAFQFER